MWDLLPVLVSAFRWLVIHIAYLVQAYCGRLNWETRDRHPPAASRGRQVMSIRKQAIRLRH